MKSFVFQEGDGSDQHSRCRQKREPRRRRESALRLEMVRRMERLEVLHQEQSASSSSKSLIQRTILELREEKKSIAVQRLDSMLSDIEHFGKLGGVFGTLRILHVVFLFLFLSVLFFVMLVFLFFVFLCPTKSNSSLPRSVGWKHHTCMMAKKSSGYVE